MAHNFRKPPKTTKNHSNYSCLQEQLNLTFSSPEHYFNIIIIKYKFPSNHDFLCSTNVLYVEMHYGTEHN